MNALESRARYTPHQRLTNHVRRPPCTNVPDMAAVCVITGVGLTNTITPMAVALADSVPMLVSIR
jgi:hypothetical protein